MSRLYLIRHGKPASIWGQADPDPGLDPTGEGQARAARDWIMALPVSERPSRVVSSPLRRCRETAEPTALALGVAAQLDPRVGEIPTPAGIETADRPAWLKAAFQGNWSQINGDIDYDAWRQSVAASLRTRGGAAVFSHYLAINAVVSLLRGSDRVLAFRPDHASITVLETDGTTLKLIATGREAATGVL